GSSHDPDTLSLRQDRLKLASVSGRVKWTRAWNPAFGAASSRRAAAQVRQVVHAQTLGDFPQPGPAGGEEAGQQPARGQLLQPRLPVFGVAPQPLENPGQLAGDHGFALAEQPPGVFHQEQVIAERESFEHPFACRIQPPSILDRVEPQPLFQLFRSCIPSPSRKARRTQRVTQWYQRVTAGSTRWARAIVMGGSPGMIRTSCGIQPAESILLCMSLGFLLRGAFSDQLSPRGSTTRFSLKPSRRASKRHGREPLHRNARVTVWYPPGWKSGPLADCY